VQFFSSHLLLLHALANLSPCSTVVTLIAPWCGAAWIIMCSFMWSAAGVFNPMRIVILTAFRIFLGKAAHNGRNVTNGLATKKLTLVGISVEHDGCGSYLLTFCQD
jgi:hypothetical protein